LISRRKVGQSESAVEGEGEVGGEVGEVDGAGSAAPVALGAVVVAGGAVGRADVGWIGVAVAAGEVGSAVPAQATNASTRSAARPSSLRTIGLLSNSRRAGSADLRPCEIDLGHPIYVAVFGDGDLNWG
jgi:hypothetical protein